MDFFKLLQFLKSILTYCDGQKEIKPKRERIKMLENELEQSINVLQMLNVAKNQLEIDLDELRQQHVLLTNDKHNLEALLDETEAKLVNSK